MEICCYDAAPAEQEVQFKACSFDDFLNIVNSGERVAFMFTKAGCEACAIVKGKMNELEQRGVTKDFLFAELEIEGDDDPCLQLFDELGVTHTPTVMIYDRGMLHNRWTPGNNLNVSDLEGLFNVGF